MGTKPSAASVDFLWIDDAWVTGYLARDLGITHLDFNEVNLGKLLKHTQCKISSDCAKFQCLASSEL